MGQASHYTRHEQSFATAPTVGGGATATVVPYHVDCACINTQPKTVVGRIGPYGQDTCPTP